LLTPGCCLPVTLAPSTDSSRCAIRNGRVMLVNSCEGPTSSGCIGGGPVASDREEPNRVFGMPLQTGPHARQDEEQQRVLGVPAGWFGPVDRDWFRSLAHPVRGYRRWLRRRRLGPYAVDEDEPRPGS
jgi:hypothetical protein